MYIFSYDIPLWAVFLAVIVIALIGWKLIKFALKILLVLVVFFLILMGLDFIGFFSWLQTMVASLL